MSSGKSGDAGTGLSTYRMSHAGTAGAVNQWLKEVRLTTETECVCVLQGKSLSAQSSDIHLPPSRSLKGMYITSLHLGLSNVFSFYNIVYLYNTFK